MRLLAKNPQVLVLDEGSVLDGYTVVAVDDAHAGPEPRYAVTAPGGERATLHLSRRPFVDRRERTRFRRLARLRVAFSHPAAIGVHDFGEHAAHPYLVTEPQERERTFADLLAEEAPLEPERLIAMLEPVADALDRAHRQGLVHQGLGSDSLLLAARDRLRIDAFGLFEVSGECTAWGRIERADLRYRAPEHLRGEPLEPGANVYSLAALVVHALTGEPPYSGDPYTLMNAHVAAQPPAVSERVPALDAAIDPVLARALAKAPAARPSSATVMLAEVAGALGIAVSPTAADAYAPALDPPATVPARAASAKAASAGTSTTAPLAGGAVPTARAKAPRGRRLPAIAVAGVAALCGAAFALAVDPFGDDAPTAEPPRAAAAWERLDVRRAGLREQLAAAATPQEQAAIAGGLADAYQDAARAAGPGPQARAARAVRDAYTSLAAAAESGNEAGYGLASAAIAQAEQQLQARR